MKTILYILSFFALVVACQNDTVLVEPIAEGYDYYPLRIGKYITYQVDSVLYDPTDGQTVRDSSFSQVRERIVDSWRSADDKEWFRIERAIYDAANDDWQVTDIYSTYVDETQAVRFEENLNFIKLRFPIRVNRPWRGLDFDDDLEVDIADEPIELFKNWESIVTTIDEPRRVGNFDFSEVSTVQLANDTNLIELRAAYEQYAKGVGLVYREVSILNTQNIQADDSVLWAEKGEEGFLMRQWVIDYN